MSPPPPGAPGADSPEQWLGCCKHPSFICLPSGRLVSLSLCVFSSRSNLYNHKKCPTTFLSLGKHPPYIKGSNNTIRGSRGRCWRSVPAARGLSGPSHALPQISRGSRMWPPCLRKRALLPSSGKASWAGAGGTRMQTRARRRLVSKDLVLRHLCSALHVVARFILAKAPGNSDRAPFDR